jgi:arsenate reductase
MAALKFYGYRGCGTCRKAVQWLNTHEIAFTEHAIRETPPSPVELQRALHEGVDGNRKKLCNTSGGDYHASDLKERIAEMPEESFLHELTSNGNLIKRPVVIAADGCLVGFKLAQREDFFGVQ